MGDALVPVPLPLWTADEWNATGVSTGRQPYLFIPNVHMDTEGDFWGFSIHLVVHVAVVNPSFEDLAWSSEEESIFTLTAAHASGGVVWTLDGGTPPAGPRPWTITVPPLSAMYLGIGERGDMPHDDSLLTAAVPGHELPSESLSLSEYYECEWSGCSTAGESAFGGGGSHVAVVGPAGSVVGVTVVVATLTEPGRYAVMAPLLTGYTRLRRRHLLDQYTRGRLHGYIVANPGASIATLRQGLGLGNGTTLYHLRLLEKEALITSRRDGMRRRFYPPAAAGGSKVRTLSVTQGLILDLIRDSPDISQRDIARRAGASAQVVSYHVLTLERAGLVDSELDRRDKLLRLAKGRITAASDGTYETSEGLVLRREGAPTS